METAPMFLHHSHLTLCVRAYTHTHSNEYAHMITCTHAAMHTGQWRGVGLCTHATMHKWTHVHMYACPFTHACMTIGESESVCSSLQAPVTYCFSSLVSTSVSLAEQIQLVKENWNFLVKARASKEKNPFLQTLDSVLSSV